nr:hypothetical protein [Tanacetum cinerariifolium]
MTRVPFKKSSNFGYQNSQTVGNNSFRSNNYKKDKAKAMKMNLTQLCDLDPMLDDTRILEIKEEKITKTTSEATIKDVLVIVLLDEESEFPMSSKRRMLSKNSTFLNNIEVHIVSSDDENKSDEAFTIRFKRFENPDEDIYKNEGSGGSSGIKRVFIDLDDFESDEDEGGSSNKTPKLVAVKVEKEDT